MKNEKKVSELLNCDSVIFKSGNIVGWGDLNNNVGQTATEEIEICLSSTIDKWLQKEEEEEKSSVTDKSVVVNFCPQLPLKPEERDDMKITVKVFVNSNFKASVKEAVEETLAELGVDSVETVILSVNLSQSNATNHLDVIKPHWRELEEFVSRGVVYSLGISDLNLALLTALYDWAKVKPLSHQVNLTNCCSIPPEMTQYAKQHDLQLFTHSDPTEILPLSSIDQVMQTLRLPEDRKHPSTSNNTPSDPPLNNSSNNSASKNRLELSWLSRYLVLIRCRGIIKSKGYLCKVATQP